MMKKKEEIQIVVDSIIAAGIGRNERDVLEKAVGAALKSIRTIKHNANAEQKRRYDAWVGKKKYEERMKKKELEGNKGGGTDVQKQ